VAVLAEATEGDGAEVLAGNCELLVALSNLTQVEIRTTSITPPEGAATISGAGVTFYLLDMVDTAAELARLEKEKVTLEKGIGGIRGKLSNENFTARAPKDVVDRERERMEEMLAKLDAVNQSIEALA
jgi:valyl-tRNA synthetase